MDNQSNTDSEAAVLGWIIADDLLLHEAKNILETKHFYATAHQHIFQAMLDINIERGHIDLPSLIHKLKVENQLVDIGGPDYLAEIARIPTQKDHFNYHCNQVLKSYIKRKVIESAIRVSNSPESDNIQDLISLSNAYDKTELQSQFSFAKDLPDHVARYIDNPKKEPPLSVGFDRLDEILGGLRGGDLFTVAGRPGAGKTSFLVKVAVNMAEKWSTIYFPSEMTQEQFVNRILTFRAGVDSWRFRKGEYHAEDLKKVNDACGKMHDSLKLISVDSPCPSLADIKSAISRNNPKVVIIDYLQRCHKPKGENVTRMTDAFMTSLKTILIESKTIGIIGCQLNRRVDKAAKDDVPTMADLRDSGSIEHESDQVMILHCKDILSQEPFRKIDGIVLKNRHGKLGIVELEMERRYVHMMPARPMATFDDDNRRLQPEAD